MQNTDCAPCRRGFEHPPTPTDQATGYPQINGTRSSYEDATRAAGELLTRCRSPLFGGLSSDVQGARALLRLAHRVNATLDHVSSTAILRNTLALQDSGWMNTTYSEVRNRADLLIVIASKLADSHPRFFERTVFNDESMFDLQPSAREVLVIGPAGQETIPSGMPITHIPCSAESLPEVINVLRAMEWGHEFDDHSMSEPSIKDLRHLLERIKGAEYSVVTWNAAGMNFPHAELTIQAVCEFVKQINRTTRCSVLPFTGNHGATTFAQVSGWTTGFSTRYALMDGAPIFEPIRHGSRHMLDSAQADLLLWLDAFDSDDAPPPPGCPAIVIGRTGMRCQFTPDVYIPVATPGIDHPGHVFRGDTVAALPLTRLRSTDLPSAASILDDLHAHTGERAAEC